MSKKVILYLRKAEYRELRDNRVSEMGWAALGIYSSYGAGWEELDRMQPSLEKALEGWWDSCHTCLDDRTGWGRFLIWWRFKSPLARLARWVKPEPKEFSIRFPRTSPEKNDDAGDACPVNEVEANPVETGSTDSGRPDK